MATWQAPQFSRATVSVMISYSRTDSQFVDQLQRDLEARGFPTWVDRRDIDAGTVWDKEIVRGIEDARVVLVVMTPTSMASKWVRKEYSYALSRRKVVIPLLYYPCDPPAPLARLQTVDFRPNFFNPQPYYAQQLARLTASLMGYGSLDDALAFTPMPRRRGERAISAALATLMTLALIVVGVAVWRSLTGTGIQQIVPFLPVAIPLEYVAWLFVTALALALACGVAWLAIRARRQAPATLYRKDRERFLIKIHTRYTNRLKPSFAGAVLLPLTLREDPHALANSPTTSQPDVARLLPAGTSMSEVLQQAEGQLLILGDPGSGKSTLLYQLALDLVARARANAAIPIPVVFNLASWALGRQRLYEWLALQLVVTWQVPPAIAQTWIKRREVAPLLDGLDEVPVDARDACVAAINDYHRAHGLEPLALCCRTADYYARGARLDVRRAVAPQPLTAEQINAYLTNSGGPLVALRDLAWTDAEVRALLSTPLLLNIVSIAYAGRPANTIPRPTRDRMAWTQIVFHDYVQRMLSARPGAPGRARYSEAEIARYLAWLAALMRWHGQADMFYLDRVQPDWLPDESARRGWRWRVRLQSALIVGASAGIVYGLIASLVDTWAFNLGTGLIFGLAIGAFVLLTYTPLYALAAWLIYWPDHRPTPIALTARVRWFHPSWSRMGHALLVGLGFGFALGIPEGVGFGAIEGIASAQQSHVDLLTAVLVYAIGIGLLLGLANALIFGLTGGVIGGLIAGLGAPEAVDARDLTSPAEGALRSLRAGALVSAVSGLLFSALTGVAWGLFAAWVSNPTQGVITGLSLGATFGVVFGLVFGLDTGLRAYIQHTQLQRALARKRLMPSHMAPFLDFAADHVLLQRVGGGYRFIHALLLDYFAAQWPAVARRVP
jgi:hypothetical protein